MVGKILIGIGSLAVILFAIAFFSIKSNQNEPPPKLTANFVDLNKIEKISKYRSCAGHLVIPQDGSQLRSNMKHYFWVKKEFIKDNTVEIYAPYHGYVSTLYKDEKENLEGEIWISPKKIFALLPPFGMWNFSVQHINVRPNLKVGSEVKAGELIGYAALTDKAGDSFDIVYAKLSIPPKRIDNWSSPYGDLDSVFNHMDDNVFALYRQKGIPSKEDLLIGKEQRAQSPCKYNGSGPNFILQEGQDDWSEFK